MAKWEYCVVTWTAGVVSDEQKQNLEKAGFQGRIREAEDGAAFAQLGGVDYFGSDEQEQIVDLGETLARLGGEGWELITVTPSGGGRTQFWLKHQVD